MAACWAAIQQASQGGQYIFLDGIFKKSLQMALRARVLTLHIGALGVIPESPGALSNKKCVKSHFSSMCSCLSLEDRDPKILLDVLTNIQQPLRSTGKGIAIRGSLVLGGQRQSCLSKSPLSTAGLLVTSFASLLSPIFFPFKLVA